MSIRMDGPDSECAGLRFVGTHHLSWVRWSKGCKTLTSSQLEGLALFCPLQAGPRFPHARQKHLCSTPRWTECPWNREDTGQTESCSRVWWSQRDGLGNTGQAPRDRTSGTRGATDMYPRWGSEVEHREPTRKAVHPKVGSEWRRMPWCFTGLAAAETGSGSDSANLTLPDGDRTAESSSPEPSLPSVAAIDILSSAGVPNEILGPALSEDSTGLSRNTRWCDALEEWEARGDTLDREALTVILKSPWPWVEVALWEPEKLERGMTRPVWRGGIWSAASRCSCSCNENMTHPRALLQRAESPSTRHSNRDCQMKLGKDHIQKHMSGKPSLIRRLSLVELF